MKANKGFTLIELLVVISIIALLMAILMPALGNARKAGKRIQCASNMKSLSLTMHLYASDNKGKNPSGDTQGDDDWADHSGGLAYYNLDNEYELLVEQQEAIKKGALWPYTGESCKGSLGRSWLGLSLE